MKKIGVVVFLFAFLVTDTFGQSMADVMLNTRNYSSIFFNSRGNLDVKYVMAATDEDWDRIAVLGGDPGDIDTALEISLLSNSVGVIGIRPVEANRMLGTPRQADLKLGAAVFQEIQILRFLGNTTAVGRHEGVLQHSIISRGNVSRAEIETFYRNGIRGLISEIVDGEFNEIRFIMGSPTGGYHVKRMNEIQV